MPDMTTELSLAGRGLTSDQLRLKKFHSTVTKIDLSDNQLTTLYGVRFPEGLEELILKNNALFFDAAREPYPSRSLLSGERDPSYVSSFPPNLKILDLSGTLFSLHDDLKHLTKLESLILRGARVSPKAQIPKSLKTIDLRRVVFANPKDLEYRAIPWQASKGKLQQLFPKIEILH